MAVYYQFDRTIWKQLLPLNADQKQKILVKLEHDILEENRYYAYDHFDDNCTITAPQQTVELPLLPCATVSAPGLAAIVKSGVCVCVPASALISAGVGLPHPVTRSYPATAEKLPEVPLVMS